MRTRARKKASALQGLGMATVSLCWTAPGKERHPAAQRPRDEPPGQPSLVSRETQTLGLAGIGAKNSPERSGGGSIELLGGADFVGY